MLGPGVRARWLVEQGYLVKLVDVIERHIEEARDSGLDAELGDADAGPPSLPVSLDT